ncbi:MAG TPA: hypothetical protein VGL22_21075 [Terracidiphilus sp.]|jgi:hypothetical protein
MSFGTCTRERELADALRAGHWPHAAAQELRAHVTACNACSQRVLLAQAFRRERAMASSEPRLESPGVLWWRAQLRRRNAAIQRISRPLLGAQVFAVAVALVAAVAFLISQVRNSAGWFAWIADAPRALHLEALVPESLQNATGAALLVGCLLAVVAIAGGFAAFASSDKH